MPNFPQLQKYKFISNLRTNKIFDYLKLILIKWLHVLCCIASPSCSVNKQDKMNGLGEKIEFLNRGLKYCKIIFFWKRAIYPLNRAIYPYFWCQGHFVLSVLSISLSLFSIYYFYKIVSLNNILMLDLSTYWSRKILSFMSRICHMNDNKWNCWKISFLSQNFQ